MKENSYQKIYLFIILLKPTGIFSCTFPVSWDGLWYDSTDDAITFSRNTQQVTSGWTVTLGASSVSSWTCVAEDISNRQFLFRGDSSLSFFSSTIIPYLCIQWTNVTDYSFYYYILADIQSNGVNERVYMENYNPAITSWSTTTYCSPTNPPGDEEYHMAVKQGFDTSAKIEFPTDLLGKFTYTYSDGGSNFCTVDSYLDICSDQTTAIFNYTVCSTKQLFSSEGIVYCVASFTSGTTTYVNVYNPGIVDNVNYFRMSCLAMETSGTGITASVSAGSCQQSQTATVATSTGGVLSFSAIDNCTSTTSIMTTSVVTTANTIITVSNSNVSSLNATKSTSTQDWFCSTLDKDVCYGILSGVCVAGMASFVAVAFVFCLHFYKKRNKRDNIRKIDKFPVQLIVKPMKEPMISPRSTNMY